MNNNKGKPGSSSITEKVEKAQEEKKAEKETLEARVAKCEEALRKIGVL